MSKNAINANDKHIGIIRGSIPCNGIKPTKSEVYTIAAELVELYEIKSFRKAIYCAMMLYDYYYDDYYYAYAYDYYCNDYYYDDYACDYDYYDYCNDYAYAYAYYDYSIPEKVIALLFLAALYS